MHKKAIFIGATGQHVGKTTACLGILASLKKNFDSVGFIKPVGQQHIAINDQIKVDKDVILFKTHFDLPSDWSDMSPVIIPPGFTRSYLDGEITESKMTESVVASFEKIASSHTFTVVEGTGHIGVGSIINMNNAAIASKLGLEMVIICSGGLGSAYDELAINIAMAEKYGVKVRGVILNKVMMNKREMILDYFPKALKDWDVPLIGCIPYLPFLSNPTVKDFELLFKTPLLSGLNHRYRHFTSNRLVGCSVDAYQDEIQQNELVITLASREDIIDAFFDRHEQYDLESGMILTGRRAPSQRILERIRGNDVPVIYVPSTSYDVMTLISTYVAKIRAHDYPKVQQAIQLMEEHIDVKQLCNL